MRRASFSQAITCQRFCLRLDAASASAVTVKYWTSNRTATRGTDYTGIYTTTLTFTPGETIKTVSVPIVNNFVAEAQEYFWLNLGSQSAGSVHSRAYAMATIVDNDTALTTPRAYVEDRVVDEKDGVVHFTVKLDAASTSQVTLDYATRCVSR